LSHPNIVKLIDWGQSGHLLFMVQELIEGQTLKDTFVRPLSQARFIHIFLPIMRALRTAHDKGVVHRDLKPSNIMVTHTDVIKLMDFGIAKANRPGHDLTRTGDAFGTPNYMSPEQISGGAIDASSDVYSLGIMAFELLTGQLPFEAGEDPMSVMLAHLHQEPKRLETFRTDLSPDIVATVQKMMSKDPADRFPDLGPVIAIFEAAPRVY
jgi:serine/threonine protein kinase